MTSTWSSSSGVRALRKVLGSELLKAFVIFSLAILVFFGKPLTTGKWYAPGDVSGLSKLLEPAHGQAGEIRQIDVTVDVLPWADYNRTELRAGRLPLWNPYNSAGVPHVGNLQSAVFSPFMVPFYVLPMWWALYVSVYLLLMTAGLLMYGLIRHLRLSSFAAFGGALAYMFCAFNVLWLHWPLASVAAFLPGIFWGASGLVRANGWRRVVGWGGMLALFIAARGLRGTPGDLGVRPASHRCLVRGVARVQRSGVARRRRTAPEAGRGGGRGPCTRGGAGPAVPGVHGTELGLVGPRHAGLRAGQVDGGPGVPPLRGIARHEVLGAIRARRSLPRGRPAVRRRVRARSWRASRSLRRVGRTVVRRWSSAGCARRSWSTATTCSVSGGS